MNRNGSTLLQTNPFKLLEEHAVLFTAPTKAPSLLVPPGEPPDVPEAPEITRKDRPMDAHGAPPPTHAYIDFSLKKSNSEAIILKACIDNNYIIIIKISVSAKLTGGCK